jgi:hypothetical protein
MAADNSPSNSANQLNITVQNESENYRNIRRNSSNQIVSYPLSEKDIAEGKDEFGFKRIPGSVGMFNKIQYKRTIPQLSSELIVTPVEFETQIIEQNRLDEEKIYKVQNFSLRSVRGGEVEEPEDVFSARYELTPNAPSYRYINTSEISNSQRDFGNTHFGGISYHNDGVRSATDGYITFKGHKELAWDKKIFGPELDQYGYRVTEELKDSGRDLFIRAVVSFRIGHSGGSNVGAYAAIMRKRSGRTNEENRKRVKTEGSTVLGSDQPFYPMHVLELTIPNDNLEVNDLYQITSNFGSANDGVYIMGDKCVFEVICPLPEDPPTYYPSNTNSGTNSYVGGGQGIITDVAEESADRAS